MDAHISQIPGLSPTIEAEDRAQGQRGRIHDRDSDYIKLAKQGGHKGRESTCKSISVIIDMYPRRSFLHFTGLLWHEDTFEAKAASYKPPDWFCAASEPDSTTWYPVQRYVYLIYVSSGIKKHMKLC